jgi:hypothetical protein
MNEKKPTHFRTALASLACAARAPLSLQRGQALTEFLVVALAIIPLMLLIPMIAKYQDVSNSTQLASRYVAFEATQFNDTVNAFKSEADLANEVRRRFYSNTDAPIKTGDVAGDFKAHQNLFWRDPKGGTLLKPFDEITVSFGTDTKTTHQEGFKSISNESISFGTSSVPSMMGLGSRGVYRANVSVPLVNLPEGIKSFEPFDKINLSMTRQTSIAFDHWAARSPQQTEARFGRLAPISSALQNIEPAIDVAVTLLDKLPGEGGVTPPRFGRLERWRDFIQEDRVPAPAPAQ